MAVGVSVLGARPNASNALSKYVGLCLATARDPTPWAARRFCTGPRRVLDGITCGHTQCHQAGGKYFPTRRLCLLCFRDVAGPDGKPVGPKADWGWESLQGKPTAGNMRMRITKVINAPSGLFVSPPLSKSQKGYFFTHILEFEAQPRSRHCDLLGEYSIDGDILDLRVIGERGKSSLRPLTAMSHQKDSFWR